MIIDDKRGSAAPAPVDPVEVVRRLDQLCRWYLQLAITLLAAAAVGWLFRITGKASLDLAGSFLVLALTIQATAPLAAWSLQRRARRRASNRLACLHFPILVIWLLAALALMHPTLALLDEVLRTLAAPVT